MVATSNTHDKKSESEQVQGESGSDELRREAELVASTGLISKRTMAIAFGLVFLVLGLTSTAALGFWGAGSLGLLGIVLVIWSLVQTLHHSRR